MNFAVLPPEINSARIYAGPGSAPMLAAAAAWDGVAAELQLAARSYESVIAGLTCGLWVGPSSASMAAAAAAFVMWTRDTAAQAEQAAGQAAAAAAAYETVFAQTVPPPVVAANRSLLTVLIATNLFGQNTPAIAAAEAHYAEMWVQDAAAMYGYAGSSASATMLNPFTPPPPNTETGWLPLQAAAVTRAAGLSAGHAQHNTPSAARSLSAVPTVLSGLASPAASLPLLAPLEWLDLAADLSGLFVDPEIGVAGLGLDSIVGITGLPYDVVGYQIGVHTDDIVSGWAGLESFPGTAAVPPTPFAAPITNVDGSAVSAGLGEADSTGALSVPPTWTVEAPAIRPLAVALPAAGLGAGAEVAAGGAGTVFSQMALAGMAGRAMACAGNAGRRERIGAVKQRPTAPVAGSATGPITGIAAELRELASLRDAGILTEDEFTEQKQRLLPR